jgi:transcriptional regulator with XRE-family HTH domain
MSTFSERLRMLREREKITLDELAIKIHSTKSTLSRYENNKRIPNIEFVERVANFFNVTSDYLLGRTDKPNLELINRNLPQELIDAGIQAIKVFKGLKVEDLTPNDIQYLIEFAEKVQKNRP